MAYSAKNKELGRLKDNERWLKNYHKSRKYKEHLQTALKVYENEAKETEKILGAWEAKFGKVTSW